MCFYSTEGPQGAPPTAVWEPTEVSMGAILRTRLPVCPKSRCSVRVSPRDNYSCNMELAIEALIRMKMSQLARYQSISGETRFKEDIKDGGTVSSLIPNHPHKFRARLSQNTRGPVTLKVGVHKRLHDVNKYVGRGGGDCARIQRLQRSTRTRAAPVEHDALESPGRKVDCFLPPPALLCL